MVDEPIEEQDFLGGVSVVDLGDVRVARGLSRRHHSGCSHRRLVYDKAERRIWCKDCEHDVDPFDAFLNLLEPYDSAFKEMERREQRLREAEQFQVRSLAAKQIDKAWRSRSMIPICPSCHSGLFPEDFKNGVALMDRDFARLQAAKRND